MKLIVSDEIQGTFPHLRIAILVGRGIDNRGTDSGLQELKLAAADRVYREFTYDHLNELAEIQAWREAYRTFGVKPKDSRPTAEAFLRRLIKGDGFPTISKAVDSYLLTETEYYLPVGGYDLSTITGDIRLRFSEGDEIFTPIGANSSEVTRAGEVVYSDDARILTRKWNYRDCDHCKITEQSRDIALFAEAPFDTISTTSLDDSIHRMAELVEKHCGGNVHTMLLDASKDLEIPLG
jgi:DNA/RNA-binding domain of Phe-tRNA-synthetase-like protein